MNMGYTPKAKSFDIASRILQRTRDWHFCLQRRFLLHPAVQHAFRLADPLDWQRLLLEWPHVAETDVTRVATFSLGGEGQAIAIPEIGITESRHQLSHHGGDMGYMEKLTNYDKFAIEQFSYFLTRLTETTDLAGKPLLGSTMALFGSGMSYGHSHGNANLPLVLAGGSDLGLKHGQHLDFNREAKDFQGYALDADGALTSGH
jgi:hypothetical protein